jgi:hypothetical protein
VFQVGTTDAAGFWASAFSTNELENGTLTLLLVEGFSGSVGNDLDTNNDGVLDTTPWTRVVDSVGVTDGGGSDRSYSPVVLSAGFDGLSSPPGGASRIPDGFDTDSPTDWVRNNFDGEGLPGFVGTLAGGEALNTPGTPNQLAVANPLINEFVFNHAGPDTNEFIEVFGSPSTSYAAFYVLEIEGDGGGAGTIDGVFQVGDTDAGGFWTRMFDNELENGTVTLVLVQGLSGSAGSDLDTDNDGVLDATPWLRIVDAVGVTDGDAGDHNYSPLVLGPGFDGGSLTPGGASRIPNGTDTDIVSDWMRNDFDGEGLLPGVVGTAETGEALNTPGDVNNAVPDPSGARASVEVLWPPNHEYVPIEIVGVTDPDGDPLVITIDSIFQDEAVDAKGSGNTSPDGRGVGTAVAEVRAERTGTGNGRVYHISFTATDSQGGTTSGTVLVSVPHSVNKPAVDDGAIFDSTAPAAAALLARSTRPQRASSSQQKDEDRNDDLPPIEWRHTSPPTVGQGKVNAGAADKLFASIGDGEDDEDDFLGRLSE